MHPKFYKHMIVIIIHVMKICAKCIYWSANKDIHSTLAFKWSVIAWMIAFNIHATLNATIIGAWHISISTISGAIINVVHPIECMINDDI